MPDRPLFRFLVTMRSGQQMFFWAETAGHAIEQADNAEPNDPAIDVRLVNDVDPVEKG
jgi:hypothetical protein